MQKQAPAENRNKYPADADKSRERHDALSAPQKAKAESADQAAAATTAEALLNKAKSQFYSLE